MLMAAFLTIWCLIDARSGGKYDTLFEFSPMEITDHDSFDSVMKFANGQETIVHFHKQPGGKGGRRKTAKSFIFGRFLA